MPSSDPDAALHQVDFAVIIPLIMAQDSQISLEQQGVTTFPLLFRRVFALSGALSFSFCSLLKVLHSVPLSNTTTTPLILSMNLLSLIWTGDRKSTRLNSSHT